MTLTNTIPSGHQHRALPTFTANEISPRRCPAHLAPAGLGREVGIQGEVPGCWQVPLQGWDGPMTMIRFANGAAQKWRVNEVKSPFVTKVYQSQIRRVPLWFGPKGFKSQGLLGDTQTADVSKVQMESPTTAGLPCPRKHSYFLAMPMLRLWVRWSAQFFSAATKNNLWYWW